MKISTGKTGSEALEPAEGEMLTAQEATAELRVLRQRIVQVTTLSKKDRKAIWQRGDMSIPVTQASITIIDANETVEQALKTPAADVRALIEEADYWDAFVVELRGLMQGVSDANLVRRERIAILAAQAYAIGRQLARDPSNERLQEHLEAVRRLKRLGRRKKRAPATPEGAAAEPPAGDDEE